MRPTAARSPKSATPSHPRLGQRLGNRRYAVGVVVAAPGEHAHAVAVAPADESETVVFCFVGPLRPGRDRIGERWQARFYKAERAASGAVRRSLPWGIVIAGTSLVTESSSVFTEEMPTASSSTKERLLDQAMRLFGQRGYDATSVAEIERSAGLTPGAGGWPSSASGAG